MNKDFYLNIQNQFEYDLFMWMVNYAKSGWINSSMRCDYYPQTVYMSYNYNGSRHISDKPLDTLTYCDNTGPWINQINKVFSLLKPDKVAKVVLNNFEYVFRNGDLTVNNIGIKSCDILALLTFRDNYLKDNHTNFSPFLLSIENEAIFNLMTDLLFKAGWFWNGDRKFRIPYRYLGHHVGPTISVGKENILYHCGLSYYLQEKMYKDWPLLNPATQLGDIINRLDLKSAVYNLDNGNIFTCLPDGGITYKCTTLSKNDVELLIKEREKTI